MSATPQAPKPVVKAATWQDMKGWMTQAFPSISEAAIEDVHSLVVDSFPPFAEWSGEHPKRLVLTERGRAEARTLRRARGPLRKTIPTADQQDLLRLVKPLIPGDSANRRTHWARIQKQLDRDLPQRFRPDEMTTDAFRKAYKAALRIQANHVK